MYIHNLPFILFTNKSRAPRSWHTKVVSKVANVESTIFFFFEFWIQMFSVWQCKIDAHPNSLTDLIVSPKVKTTKDKESEHVP
jgi:hypothetical protein